MQKIMVVSHTHGHHENFRKALRTEGNIDLLIHLGDSEGEEDYIAALTDCETVIVAGNCDYFSRLDKEMMLQLGSKKAFITHGHYYSVSLGTEVIIDEAVSREADIVMFGHTHKPVVEEEDGIMVINPGSISYPRQENRKPSYIIIAIDNENEFNYEIKYI